MKATYAGLATDMTLSVLANKLYNCNSSDYLYICNRHAYEILFHIPVVDFSDVQLYVDFGAVKPLSFVSTLISLCDATTVTNPPCHYVLGVAPTGLFYGVFRFQSSATPLPTLFVIALDVTMQDGSIRRYLTESHQVEPCVPVTKIEACFPSLNNSLGYDSNGIYFGFTTDLVNTSGNPNLRYLHFVNVRKAKVYEDAPKLTFSANIRQNFKSVLNRIFELKTELVPAWYKDYMLAVYTRGFIQITGVAPFVGTGIPGVRVSIVYQVTDLAVEGIDDNDYIWRPNAKLKKETRFYFGCDTTPCSSECCSPCSVAATVETIVDPCCSPAAESVTATTETIEPESARFNFMTFTSQPDGNFTDVLDACNRAAGSESGFAGATFYISLAYITGGGELFNGGPVFTDPELTIPFAETPGFTGYRVVRNYITTTLDAIDFASNPSGTSIFKENC